MSRKRNTVLEGLLGEFGYTQEELADEVNRVAYAMLGSNANCTDRHVRRWVSGDVRWPWIKYLLSLQEIFGRPPEAMGFVPRSASSWVPAPPPRSTRAKEPPVRRRNFVTAGLATAIGIDTVPEAGRLGASDVQHIQHIATGLRRQDEALGGGALKEVGVEALARVRQALDRCAYGDRMGRQLYSAAADLTASVGAFACDAGHHRDATALYREALQAAILARDTCLQARVLSVLTMQAWMLERHQEALQLAQAAVELRQIRGNARLMALLYGRLGVGYARTGQRALAERALARAESAFNRATGETEAWLSFVTPAEMSWAASGVYRALGHHARAETHARAAMELLGPGYKRTRALGIAHHALTLVSSGEVEGAVAQARQVVALGEQVQSHRVRERLLTLRADFGRHSSFAPAAEFREQTRHLEV